MKLVWGRGVGSEVFIWGSGGWGIWSFNPFIPKSDQIHKCTLILNFGVEGFIFISNFDSTKFGKKRYRASEALTWKRRSPIYGLVIAARLTANVDSPNLLKGNA